jgi:hypothetical protein
VPVPVIGLSRKAGP